MSDVSNADESMREKWRDRLASLSHSQRSRLLTQTVRRYIASEVFNPLSSFRQMRVTRGRATQLREALSADFGVTLSATVLFDHPSPAALADHLSSLILGSSAASQLTAPAQSASSAVEPLAIVGMSCRLPGGIESPEDLWRTVVDGVDAVSGFPNDRNWDPRLYDSDPDRSGKTSTRFGGFIHNAAEFDADFFGISPREALAIDPQQRLLLETAWEACESAGFDPLSLRGSRTGVFAGIAYQDYQHNWHNAPSEVEGYVLTGALTSVASGRISYALGLEGPTLTVDTACSSALVALHLAAQSLRQGECSMALVGGATIMSSPGVFVEFSRKHGLAPDGRCKSFAAGADGTGWGEGVGVVVLERLSDALSNGREVLAVLRGSAVNSDGSSNGLTAPNGPSQRRVVLDALSNAGLSPSDIDVVEAHGTGTPLGDPIEAQALLDTYGQDRPDGCPLWLGSVKSNIGHTQAASGIAGLIKIVMAFRHEIMPKTLHVDEPTPHLDWSSGGFRLLTENTPWPRRDGVRRAGISAFGLSGANAHLIVEEPLQSRSAVPVTSRAKLPVACVLSAKSAAALTAQASRLVSHLQARPEAPLEGVASALATTRSSFHHRAAVVAADQDELMRGLAALCGGGRDSSVVRGTTDSEHHVAFLFSGQGSQRPQMGRQLYESCDSFREALDTVCAEFNPRLECRLQDVMFASDGRRLNETQFTQPALFAMETALYRVLTYWGITPDFIAGHSIGEIAAAHCAGVMSLQDAADLVVARGRLMGELPPGGVMAAVQATEQEVLPLLIGLEHRLGIAAVNGPQSLVLSGEEDAVEEFLQQLPGRSKRLTVSHAFHSPLMDPMLAEFRRVAERVTFRTPQIPLVSNVTGGPADVTSPDYWVRHVRQAVRFHDCVRWLDENGVTDFVELGPSGTLAALSQGCLPDGAAPVISILNQQQPERKALMRVIAELHVRGVDVDWHTVFLGVPTVPLPTYAFQRERFWSATPETHIGQSIKSLDTEFWKLIGQGTPNAVAEALNVDDNASLDTVLPALQAWHRKQTQETQLAGLQYEVTWKPVHAPQTTELSGAWLVVGSGGLSDAVRTALVDHGAEVDRAASPHAVSGFDAFTGVLSIGLNTMDNLRLAKAMARSKPTIPLWCVTQGGISADISDQIQDPEKSMVWGLGRVIALEQSARWGGLIDLPAVMDSAAASTLAAVLTGISGEDQVAIRPRGLFVRRLTRAVVRSRREWRPSGRFLITGGTGALGAEAARWLAREGAQHLVLVSRRGHEAPGAATLQAELADYGAEVTIASCDVADRASLAAVLDSLPGAVTGVVHAAGVSGGFLPFDGYSESDFADVVSAKVDGAVNLDDLLGDQLEVFILFSSIAGIWGGAGQAAYAAANAYLDALAEHRRARGRPAISIAWGPWSEGGMAADPVVVERLRRSGLSTLDPALGIAALSQAIASDEANVIFADVAWEEFRTTFTAARVSALLRDLPDAAHINKPESDTGPHAGEGGLRDSLIGLHSAARIQVLLEVVLSDAAEVLGYDSSARIDASRPFTDLGFDSLSVVQLCNRLTQTTGLRLPATAIYDHPTPSKLTDHLLADLVGAAVTDGDEQPVPAVTDGEAIAVVGMSCRYPGGVNSPEDLWRLVSSGGHVVSPFPEDRGWDLENLYDPDPSRRGTSYVRSGGFLSDVAGFDAEFFGITPREALAMDPQQRLLLETTWEALEDAGVDPQSVQGTHCGVFVGTNGSDYATLLRQNDDSTEGYVSTGVAGSVLSGRLAYFFGTVGPALSVDTACSSSLVAMHLAMQSLRNGECSLALSSGVTVMSTPDAFIEFSRQRGLAPDGRIKAFAEAADGTCWSEGVGVLVLERESDAVRNGHRILGLIRGSAVNSDGASNGLAAPNGPSQERVIRQALADARLTPSDVDAVEAHGTGTKLGDPIEARALLATYGRGRDKPVFLGTVKSNIGHTQAASGVAGVIKMLLAMRHGYLPPSLHIDKPSSHVDWHTGAVELLTAATPWPQADRPLRAAVSSFGISGTNAHVILEQGPVMEQGSRDPEGSVFPWVLSARTQPALEAYASALLAYTDDSDPADVAFSLATNRAVLEHRAVVLGAGSSEFIRGLSAAAVGAHANNLIRGVSEAERKVLYAFCAPDSSLAGRSVEALFSIPVFAESMTACSNAFDGLIEQPPKEFLLNARSTPIREVGKPALFAIMLSTAALLRSLGITPDAIASDPLGEITAACVSGVLSLEEAAQIIAGRKAEIFSLDSGDLPHHRFDSAVDCGVDENWEVVDVLQFGVSDRQALLESLARMFVLGADVNWGPLVASGRGVGIPNYPFQHQYFWPSATMTARPSTLSELPASLADRLTRMPEAERGQVLVNLVRAETAAVIGQNAAVAPERTFREIGLDSLATVTLTSRLRALTGVNLSTTAVFDFPSPRELAAHLTSELHEDGTQGYLDRLEAELLSSDLDDAKRKAIAQRLSGWLKHLQGSRGALVSGDLESADGEEIFDLIDDELGSF
ncbi:type I polyketide synthase [Streptomyces sp. NPDC056749]|uniref:type I polyketide synthase n=1 Tax=Streptomyces sp. NPDC056749 TaxID=3345936 RepID=UPI0036C47D8B